MMKSYSPYCSYQPGQKNHCAAGILKHLPSFENGCSHLGSLLLSYGNVLGLEMWAFSDVGKEWIQLSWLSRLYLNHEKFLCSDCFSRRAVIYVFNIKIIYCRFVAKSSQEFQFGILIVGQKSIKLSFLGLWPKTPAFLHKSQDYKSEGNVFLRFCLDLNEAFFTQSRIRITRVFLA